MTMPPTCADARWPRRTVFVDDARTVRGMAERPTVEELGAMTLEEWKAYLTAVWADREAAGPEVSGTSEELPAKA